MRWVIASVLAILMGAGLLPVGVDDGAPYIGIAHASSTESIAELRKTAFKLTQEGQFDLAEQYWGQLIERLPDQPALWSNRGNVRVSQNKVDAAIDDYTTAIRLSPFEPDPYLNRGAALEATGQWQAAIDDYNIVIKLSPDDPAAYNNRGNAQGGQGNWREALADYEHSIEINPAFSLGYTNYALALYQVGDAVKSLQILRSLVRKYPNFADARATLTAVLWEAGNQGEAESQWVAARGLDRRYADLDWVTTVRRWPPSLVMALDHFLHL